MIRDIVQNHMLQILGLIAMEPPVGFSAEYVRDEKTKVFRSIRVFDKEHIDKYTVKGQYGSGTIDGKKVPGYRQERDVSPDSAQTTFFAAKFFIDNMRWAGVPFYLRTGKRLKKRITEICIQFKRLPLRLFGRTCDIIGPNVLTFTIQPEENIVLRFDVKYPYSEDQIYSANMVFSYQDVFKTSFHPPYERLLVDCIKGDLSLFVRQDSVEEMWDVVDPIIARWESAPAKDIFPNYEAGSWGPDAANGLIERDGRSWITK